MPVISDKFLCNGVDLLKNAGATTNGVWKKNSNKHHPLCVTVAGAGTWTAKVFVTNVQDKPDDSDNNHPQLGDDVTGPDQRSTNFPQSWVKVAITAYTSGTINAAFDAG